MNQAYRRPVLAEKLLFRGLLLIALGVFSGCVALQPFPNAARAGDTIMLAVGSPDGMTRSNTTAQYVPDDDPFNPMELNIRSIFKIYPDRTSGAWASNGLTNLIQEDTAHGPWLTVVAVDLPASLHGGAGGTGALQVTSSATIGSLATPTNGLDIPIEILPGVGTPSEFLYDASSTTRTGDLLALEPLKQVVVRPPVGSATPYGAVEVKLNVPLINADGTAAPDTGFTVVLDDMGLTHLRSQLQAIWKRDGDEITVMIISPTGAMRAWEARFSVVIFEQPRLLLQMPGTIIDPAKPPPSLVSIRYFDVDGVEVSGPMPAVAVEGG